MFSHTGPLEEEEEEAGGGEEKEIFVWGLRAEQDRKMLWAKEMASWVGRGLA